MNILKENFTFVDLFAGIGGFRQAMLKYSDGKARCLYSSEIDFNAANIYEANYHEKPLGDIRKIDPISMKLKAPDVICGGFPCQTFSKGGQQAGFKDSRGTLFREILRIVESYPPKKRPKILLLENVQNLISHDGGNTWKTIYKEISEAGYNVIENPIVAAPKDFYVPQLRNRAIILAVRNDLFSKKITLNIKRVKVGGSSIKEVLCKKEEIDKKYYLSKEKLNVLNAWDDFIKIIPKDKRIIGYPIRSDEFDKNYDISDLKERKQEIIKKNRKLYQTYKKDINKWLKKWCIREDFTPTDRKFEWQAGKDIDSVFEGIIQFRTSGIRVKRPTESPALVAMDHRPIYGPEKRFITPREAARLQSFPDDFILAKDDKVAFKQLGNAVNVDVIYNIFKDFVNILNSEG